MFAKTTFSLCLTTLTLTLFAHTPLQSQETGNEEIITLSPEIGETIDRKERDRYGLFPASMNFYSAVIIRRTDGSYAAKITEEIVGKTKTRLLPIDQSVFEQLRLHIRGPFTQVATFRARENPVIVITDIYGKQIEGKLLGMEDDRVLVEHGRSIPGLEPRAASIHEIHSIILIRTSRIAAGSSGGCLLGLLAGGLMGLASGDDKEGFISFTAKDKAVILGVLFGLTGGCLGGAAGALEGKDQEFDLSLMNYLQKVQFLRQLSGIKPPNLYPCHK